MMIRLVVAFFVASVVTGCEASKSDSSSPNSKNKETAVDLKAGGLYASKNEDGKYGITKILVLDEFAVHARFYNETFDEIPSQLTSSDLTYLIGHAPMAREGFLIEEQHLITVEQVSDNELEGYHLYLEAMREQ